MSVQGLESRGFVDSVLILIDSILFSVYVMLLAAITHNKISHVFHLYSQTRVEHMRASWLVCCHAYSLDLEEALPTSTNVNMCLIDVTLCTYVYSYYFNCYRQFCVWNINVTMQ